MKLKYFMPLTGIILLCSCDPMRRINITNRSNDTATIVWKLKEDSAIHSPLFISNTTEVKFSLPPRRPHNRLNMSFGMGNWSEQYINDLIDDVSSFEIITPKSHQKFNNSVEIKNFLWAHRKGVGRRKVILLID